MLLIFRHQQLTWIWQTNPRSYLRFMFWKIVSLQHREILSLAFTLKQYSTRNLALSLSMSLYVSLCLSLSLCLCYTFCLFHTHTHIQHCTGLATCRSFIILKSSFQCCKNVSSFQWFSLDQRSNYWVKIRCRIQSWKRNGKEWNGSPFKMELFHLKI